MEDAARASPCVLVESTLLLIASRLSREIARAWRAGQVSFEQYAEPNHMFVLVVLRVLRVSAGASSVGDVRASHSHGCQAAKPVMPDRARIEQHPTCLHASTLLGLRLVPGTII